MKITLLAVVGLFSIAFSAHSSTVNCRGGSPITRTFNDFVVQHCNNIVVSPTPEGNLDNFRIATSQGPFEIMLNENLVRIKGHPVVGEQFDLVGKEIRVRRKGSEPRTNVYSLEVEHDRCFERDIVFQVHGSSCLSSIGVLKLGNEYSCPVFMTRSTDCSSPGVKLSNTNIR